MITRTQKWGNGQGVRLSKALLREAQLKIGDEVRMFVRGGRIIVEPLTKVRGRYKLKDLVAKIPKASRSRELDWGLPVGNEAW